MISIMLIIVMELAVLSACTSVYLRHPEMGKKVKCGPYFRDPSIRSFGPFTQERMHAGTMNDKDTNEWSDSKERRTPLRCLLAARIPSCRGHSRYQPPRPPAGGRVCTARRDTKKQEAHHRETASHIPSSGKRMRLSDGEKTGAPGSRASLNPSSKVICLLRRHMILR
jgi:hypothetical protein